MPDSFLHERRDFKALVETVAESEKINDPALVEKDYWIMHAVFGLKQLGLRFRPGSSSSPTRRNFNTQTTEPSISRAITPNTLSWKRSRQWFENTASSKGRGKSQRIS
jgi:hypothetical protein